MSIRVMLADDHTIVREGLSRSFQQEADVEVVGQAKDGLSAVAMAKEVLPDVIVMDIAMPDLNGIEATRQILKVCPQIKIVGLSMHSSTKYVREMFRAGASGYLLKDCSLEELATAVRTVVDGKTYVSPSIGDVVIGGYVRKPDEDGSAFAILSQREREVLQLLAEGKSTKQAGRLLGISPKTVEVHRLRVMEKLEIDNIAQLTKYAIQEGLTSSEL